MAEFIYETFADYGIFFGGRRPDAAGVVRMQCPRCSPMAATPTDCLTVWTTTGTWSCAKCGWGRGLRLRRRVRVQYLDEPKYIRSGGCEEARLWLRGRGISDRTIERNRITFQRGKQAGTHVVCFWYFVDGRPVNVKYRTTDKRMFQEPDGMRVLYKIDDVRDQSWCIICEGEIDALSFEEAGFCNAVSVPDGAPSPSAKSFGTKFEFLDGWYYIFAPMDRIYIAVDSDVAGAVLREELVRRLGWERCYIVEYPDGCKDANDVLCRYGVDVLRKCVESARRFPVDGAVPARVAFADLDMLYERDFPASPRVEMGELDDYIRFLPGMLTVITGVPSSGKSTWLDQLLLHLYLYSTDVVMRHAVFTPENKDLAIHQMRLVEQYTGMPFLPRYRQRYYDAERGCPSDPDKYLTPEVLRLAKEIIDDAFCYIHSPKDTLTIDDVLRAAEYWVEERGVRTLTIDPWNKIEHSYGIDEHLRYISRILNRLIAFAIDKKVHIFLVAHPRKMGAYDTFEDGRRLYQRPSLYDISGSADFFNMADNGIIVHRTVLDSGEPVTEVIIDKVRHKFMGRPGVVRYRFDAECQRFYPYVGADASFEAQLNYVFSEGGV